MDNVHLQIQETTQNARALEESVRVGFAEAAAASKEAVEAVAQRAEHAAERLQTTLVAQAHPPNPLPRLHRAHL